MPDQLRKQPRQQRARETVDAILAAAAELLDERGWEGFNTNLLAERAGCRVAAVYRYFPDKIAIVTTLAERVVSNWNQQFTDFDKALQKRSLRSIWPEYLRRFIRTVEGEPGALAVRRAMMAMPELRVIDRADNERLANALAHQLAHTYPRLSKVECTSVARVLIESAVALIDHSLDAGPAEARRLRRQLEIMHDSYLARLLLPQEN